MKEKEVLELGGCWSPEIEDGQNTHPPEHWRHGCLSSKYREQIREHAEPKTESLRSV